MTDTLSHHVEIFTTAENINCFCPLLASGFRIWSPAGISVYELLAGVLGIEDEYLENGIQTVLLDGKPVDDMIEHRLFESCTIALSAALPGLFGAAFRKQGHFSALRRQYDGSEASGEKTVEKIEVTIKLFNMVAGTIGPDLLSKGGRIKKDDFLHFWNSRSDRFYTENEIRLNGISTDARTLADQLHGPGNGPGNGDDTIVLTVKKKE